MRARQYAREFVEGLALAATILGFFLLLPWPGWLIAALVAVILFLGYLLWKQAPPNIRPDDQARLDELLHVLNRGAEQSVAAEDFYATWNVRIMNPLRVFAERRGVEHHFHDSRLEEKRAALFKAAMDLLDQEATHGFPPQGWGTVADRVPGYSPSEAEGLPDRERAVEGHRGPIYRAAQTFLHAHADLVTEARTRGYRIDALSRDRHPDVQKWDRIHDGSERRQ